MGLPTTREVIIAEITDYRLVGQNTSHSSPAVKIIFAYGYRHPTITDFLGGQRFVETSPRGEAVLTWGDLIQWAEATGKDLNVLDTARVAPVYDFLAWMQTTERLTI